MPDKEVAYLKAIEKHSGKWTWYQLDRHLSRQDARFVSNMREFLAHLNKNGLITIERRGESDFYSITEKGRKFLTASHHKSGEEELPYRQTIELRLIDLIDGRITGEEAASWAAAFVADERARSLDPDAWEALKALSGASDLDRSDSETFRGWLERLRASPREKFPRRSALERKLEGLLAGTVTRENASAWASRILIDDSDYPEVSDMAAWNTLASIVGADTKDPDDDGYLFNNASFRAWLEQLRALPPV